MPKPQPPLAGQDLEDLNPGVRRLVPFLRQHGFNTINSGDGQTHLCSCDLEFPFVVSVAKGKAIISEADRLYELMVRLGIEMDKGPGEDPHAGEHEHGGEAAPKEEKPPLPFVDVYYNPHTRTGQVMLAHVTDSMLPKRLPKPEGR